jgi:serine/threonine-protein kinase RsbW
MKDCLVLTFPSHPKYLAVVRAVTAKIVEVYGMHEKAVEDIKLAVDEACSNVIKHAYRGDTSQKITLTYKVTEKSLAVVIEDEGIKADMQSLKGRSLDDIRPGGLGIHFIRRVFDVVTFDTKKKTGNRLILRKYKRGEE